MAVVKNEKKVSTKSDAVETKKVTSTPTAAAQNAVAAKAEAEKKETAVAPKAEEKKTATKPAAKKPAAKKATTRKTTEKKAKRASKKAPVEKVQEVFFEYNGQQILSQDIVNRIEETWKAEGHRIASIKTLRVYINPDEQRAYYVINDKAEGKFVEL